MKKLLKKGTIILTMTIMAFSFLLPMSVLAAPKDDACKGLELTGGTCGGTADTDVNGILSTVINIFSLIVGVTAVIMIIVAGLRYITSGGDAANTKAARDTILYAVIGLVIVALAQVIVRFVLTQF